jgi:hypothetical protein
MNESSCRSLGQLVSWPGHQDTTEQSHCESRTEDGDWDRRAIRGKIAAVRGFFNAEHVVYRTAKSDDPARLRISLPEDDMSRPLEATSGRASGITAMLLQFRQTASGAEIRTGYSDASHAGWIDRKAADVPGDLRFGNRLSSNVRNRVGVCISCNGVLY